MMLRPFYGKENPKGNGAIIPSKIAIPNVGEANWESPKGYFLLVDKSMSTTV
jgi:hypothetical protein